MQEKALGDVDKAEEDVVGVAEAENFELQKKKGNDMKVVVTAQGNDMSSEIDLRFGRAKFLLVVDTETGDFEVKLTVSDGEFENSIIQRYPVRRATSQSTNFFLSLILNFEISA